MIAFGPVPSRRLGRSLGINNVSSKTCTYSCIYCQVGNTTKNYIKRQQFYHPEKIYADVQDLIVKTRKKNKTIDYLTFVPEGEPTLDINLGYEIDLLRFLNFKIAIITNGSLSQFEDVRADLLKADWLSVKIDTVEENIWHRLNNPSKKLKLPRILEGITELFQNNSKKIVTETMLVKDINTSEQSLVKVADYIAEINPDIAYLAIPIRPPAQQWIEMPDEHTVNLAYQIFKDRQINAELLINKEENTYSLVDNFEKYLLSIVAVHPLREEVVEQLLQQVNANWNIINILIDQKKIKRIKYSGSNFYLKHLPIIQ